MMNTPIVALAENGALFQIHQRITVSSLQKPFQQRNIILAQQIFTWFLIAIFRVTNNEVI